MSDPVNDTRMCLLDDDKVCDNCGECDRCDLDPNKICDNCCKCLAIEDEESEFRTVTIDGKTGGFTRAKGKSFGLSDMLKAAEEADPAQFSSGDGGDPAELTPELVAYWEQKLAEYGEAPLDDGLGEITLPSGMPVSGVRRRRTARKHKHTDDAKD